MDSQSLYASCMGVRWWFLAFFYFYFMWEGVGCSFVGFFCDSMASGVSCSYHFFLCVVIGMWSFLSGSIWKQGGAHLIDRQFWLSFD